MHDEAMPGSVILAQQDCNVAHDPAPEPPLALLQPATGNKATIVRADHRTRFHAARMIVVSSS
jgi:hypothetical protein